MRQRASTFLAAALSTDTARSMSLDSCAADTATLRTYDNKGTNQRVLTPLPYLMPFGASKTINNHGYLNYHPPDAPKDTAVWALILLTIPGAEQTHWEPRKL